jgi:hypothetical protein
MMNGHLGDNRKRDCHGLRFGRRFSDRSKFDGPASVAVWLAVTAMRGLQVPLRLLAILVCLALACPIETATAAAVGKVTKVQKQAQIGNTTAVVGTPVHMNSQLRTGPEARLEVTFVDDTVLTLGENASVVIDRYVYNPGEGTGEVALTATRAALRFTTGKFNQLREKSITVNTPVAALAVRGTDFWAGIVDYQYGVLLLRGKLDVGNSVGDVTLLPGQGTDFAPSLKDPEGPGTPYKWPPDKVARALSTTSFGVALNPGVLTPGLLIPLIPGVIPDDDKPASP